MHDPKKYKKNPEFTNESNPKEKKVSFPAKLSKILAEESDKE